MLKSPVDATAAAIYATELALWIGIMLAGVIFALRDTIQARDEPQQPQSEAQVIRNDSHQSEVTTPTALGLDTSLHQTPILEEPYHRSAFASIRKRLPKKLAHRLEERRRLEVDSQGA